MADKKYIWLLAIAFLLLAGSCKTTRMLPEDSYLLNSVKIESENPDVEADDLKSAVKQKPNREILGFFRFELWMFNLTHSPVDTMTVTEFDRRYNEEPVPGEEDKLKRPGFFARIGEIIGEPPVLYDEELHLKSMRNIQNYLNTKGYYYVNIKDSILYSGKDKRKANVRYHIETGDVYHIANIEYDFVDPFIKEIVVLDSSKTRLREGMKFDMEMLTKERERITRNIREEGYYYFNLDNVQMYADTTRGDNQVDLTFSIRRSFDSDHYFRNEIFTKQKISEIHIFPNYKQGMLPDEQKAWMATLDTMQIEDYVFMVDGAPYINPEVIIQANFIKKDDFYNVEDVEITQQHLSSLKQFKLISISFRKDPEYRGEISNRRNPRLICEIRLTPEVRQSYSLELEGTNSSGNYGAGGVISYRNSNLLRNAEIFNIKINGSLQTLLGVDEDAQRFLNTFEYGAEASLDVPKFFLPFQSETFIKKHDPRTSFRLLLNHQRRPDYTRTLVNSSFGYKWRSRNARFMHFVKPLDLYNVKVFDKDPDFEEQISNLYIQHSFKDQLITAFCYEMVYNNQDIKKNNDFWYISSAVETAGNLFYGISKSTNLEPDPDDLQYELFGQEFAQYVKGDLDIRYYQIFNQNHSLVYRGFFGMGIPYGNSTEGLPFVKRYYTGGANDIRAWQVRSLGPGSYNGGNTYNNIADMKLTLNLEYRFHMFLMVEGAFFLDAGNIWAIDSDDNRVGAIFDPNSFYKEIALGTGLGFRLDFNFFVLRFDFGAPLYDPGFVEENRWLGTFRELSVNDFTLNFGIGYPF